MDVVITYVNPMDKVWQKQYRATFGRGYESSRRFRDLGLFKYVFRGIANYCRGVDRVFLVVSTRSQVPEWIDQDKIVVVEHKDFIPRQYLPTFNSCTIESFFPLIPGLGEEFIYLNDDLIIINHCNRNDFFADDKPKVNIRRIINEPRTKTRSLFRIQLRNGLDMAQNILDRKVYDTEQCYLFPQHFSISGKLSEWKEMYEKVWVKIHRIASPLRTKENINTWAYAFYTLIKGTGVFGWIDSYYIDVDNLDISHITKAFNEDSIKIICINDTGKIDPQIDKVIALLNKKFPKKCSYEK